MNLVKTIKLFSGGKFIRSESGLSFESGSEPRMRYCDASVKDFRNTVGQAQEGYKVWSGYSAYLRAQILYRMAEMTQSRKTEINALFKDLNPGPEFSQKMLEIMVYYAGFADKYQQIVSAVNPVQGSFANSSSSESLGVVVVLGENAGNPLGFIDSLCGVLAGGNSVIGIPGERELPFLAVLSEIFATSDLPPGAANLLSAKKETLDEVVASHHEVQGVSVPYSEPSRLSRLRSQGTGNLKRIVSCDGHQCLEKITSFSETKTTWIPGSY